MFSLLRPFVFNLDPETAHDLAIKSLKFNPLPKKVFEKVHQKYVLKRTGSFQYQSFQYETFQYITFIESFGICTETTHTETTQY